MHDLTTFERRLADRLETELAGAIPAFDPAAIAATAIGARSLRDRVRNGLGLAPLPATRRRLALVLVVAALVIVTVVLAVAAARSGGQPLALVRFNGDIVLANEDGTDQRVVGHIPYSPVRNEIAWAPGGEHLALLGEDLQLTVIDRDGTLASTTRLQDRWSQFVWSSDGRRLAIFDGPWLPDADVEGPPLIQPRLDIVAPDGARDWSAALPSDFRYAMSGGSVAWSPDGRSIAIGGFRHTEGAASWLQPTIWLVDVATHAVRPLFEPRTGTADTAPTWLPDGRLLFSRQNSGIWQVDPNIGEASIVYEIECPCSGIANVAVVEPSPDGSRIAILAPNRGLAIIDLGTGATTDLHLPSGGGMLPIGWTPDGTALTTRWAESTGRPFVATSVATLEIASGELTILASDVAMYDLRR